ncbi:MAG: hypothetical protein Q7U04_10630, partial [Bacteriovorax sp.]|nr:hypothetical protein [Bacteriovorax sp.]
TSKSIDIMIYHELYETLPEDSFGLVFNFHQNTFLFVTQYRFQEPLLEAESVATLECITDGLFMPIRELAVLNRKEFKRDLDTLPFEKQYFFESEKVVFMLFEIEIKEDPYQFAFIFSQDEFENLDTIKISA